MELSRVGSTVDRSRIRIDDEERLVALRSYRILDTPQEPNYERLVDLVHEAYRCTWTAVTFVDRERQWFKAARGFDRKETPRSTSFCSIGMQQLAPLIVEDTLLDERFRDNPLVKQLGIRFFAGCPIFSSDGFGMGSVCVLDLRPRSLMRSQMTLLEKARNWVQADLERRRSALQGQAGSSGEGVLGEQKQAMKKMVAEMAWQAMVAAAGAPAGSR